MRSKEQSASCDDGAKSCESGEVPVRHFENEESPNPPAGVAFSCALGQVLIDQRVRAETHDDKQIGRGLIADIDALEHDAAPLTFSWRSSLNAGAVAPKGVRRVNRQ